MRNLIRILFILLSFPMLILAQGTVGPSDQIAWDYKSADITQFQVTTFTTCFDGANCVDIPAISGSFTDADTQVNHISFARALPALTVGQHTITIKACNVSACSTDLAFTFNLVIQPVPGSNARVRQAIP